MRTILTALCLLALAACSSQTPASPTPTPTAVSQPSPEASPVVEPSPSSPTASPSPTPKPKPTPTPAPAAWSAPRPVDALAGCWTVSVTIDDRGTTHLASDCEHGIRYASSVDGHTWTSTFFPSPAGRTDSEPALAFDGNTLTLAFTRVAPVEGGCGDDGLTDVGVYVRTRSLPDGPWSAPTKVGATKDHLQSLRTANGLQATVLNEKDGKTWYEVADNGAVKRYQIKDAAGAVSLRIGDDGKARIAYEGSGGIRYGVFNGKGFDTTTIANSGGGFDPALVLGGGNAPYVLWSHEDHGAGCAGAGPDPKDGSWFASLSGGKWTTERISPRVGGHSLAMDVDRGDLHAVVSDFQSLTYFTRPPGGAWSEKTLLTGDISSPVIRRNSATGALFVAFVTSADQEDELISVMTRP